MVKQNGIYKCEVCGNVISIIEAKDVDIMCCNQPMTLLEEKTQDEGKEKHVPIVETIEGGVKVKVGEVPHPMEETHYIELIQLIKDNNIIIEKRLKPTDKPEAGFCCLADTENLKARILCNIHGLWIS